MNWLQALTLHAQENRSCVLVTVVASSGSVPRKSGARMVVGVESYSDTLGGGVLEYEAIKHARSLLVAGPVESVISHRSFVLGNELAQCCGGSVNLQFDCHWSNNFQVQVFGAGHVAQEVARVAQRLPCVATFHDTRTEWLEQLRHCVAAEAVPSAVFPQSNIQVSLMTHNPHASVEACAPRGYFLIMTHSHELDFELVEAVLSRGDALYCGLIASKSKAKSFRNRLTRRGFSEAELSMLTAPLGRYSDTGNTPMEIAIAATADVLHIRQLELSGSSE